jgi:hypothetical protein
MGKAEVDLEERGEAATTRAGAAAALISSEVPEDLALVSRIGLD